VFTFILLALMGAGFLMPRDKAMRRAAEPRAASPDRDSERHVQEVRQQTGLIVSEALPRLVTSQFQTLRQLLPPPPQPPFDLDKLLGRARLVNRTQARAWLLDRLRATREGATFAIEGLGGVGKSSLVSAVLQEARRQGLFPDGIVVILCSG